MYKATKKVRKKAVWARIGDRKQLRIHRKETGLSCMLKVRTERRKSWSRKKNLKVLCAISLTSAFRWFVGCRCVCMCVFVWMCGFLCVIDVVRVKDEHTRTHTGVQVDELCCLEHSKMTSLTRVQTERNQQHWAMWKNWTTFSLNDIPKLWQAGRPSRWPRKDTLDESLQEKIQFQNQSISKFIDQIYYCRKFQNYLKSCKNVSVPPAFLNNVC